MVIDSLGIGAEPDCGDYGDAPSVNTALHVIGDRPVPKFLWESGLGYLLGKAEPGGKSFAAKMQEISKGKDSTTGHWEIAGLVMTRPFPTYPNGFPPELINEFEVRTGRKVIGNKPASGTEIIKELGEEHVKSGALIVYTSADSVFQIAAHEEVVPLEELYAICESARAMLVGKHAVARVIARPFAGKPGQFYRTPHRRDFSLAPLGHTVLDELVSRGLPVIAVGKIYDLFAGKGITHELHTESDEEGLRTILDLTGTVDSGLVMANLVDSDMIYGHRRNVQGYYDNLMMIDAGLSEIYSRLSTEDLLIITADHGNDPTFGAHTDHTREYVPFIALSPSFQTGKAVGLLNGFVHVAQTVADGLLGTCPRKWGKNILKEG